MLEFENLQVSLGGSYRYSQKAGNFLCNLQVLWQRAHLVYEVRWDGGRSSIVSQAYGPLSDQAVSLPGQHADGGFEREIQKYERDLHQAQLRVSRHEACQVARFFGEIAVLINICSDVHASQSQAVLGLDKTEMFLLINGGEEGPAPFRKHHVISGLPACLESNQTQKRVVAQREIRLIEMIIGPAIIVHQGQLSDARLFFSIR